MAQMQKFQFNTFFDETEDEQTVRAAEDEARANRERIHDDALKAEAHTLGFAEGKEAGITEARQEGGYITAQSLARISKLLSALAEEQTTHFKATREGAIAAATAISRKILPGLAHMHALDEVSHIIVSCLDHILDEPRIVVRLNEQMLLPLRDRVDDIATQAGYNGRIIMLAGDGIEPGDCRVEWSDGFADRDEAQVWEEIDKIIGAFLQGDDDDDNGDGAKPADSADNTATETATETDQQQGAIPEDSEERNDSAPREEAENGDGADSSAMANAKPSPPAATPPGVTENETNVASDSEQPLGD